jgi:hypothetical protein
MKMDAKSMLCGLIVGIVAVTVRAAGQTNDPVLTNHVVVVRTNVITKMPEVFSTRSGKIYESVRLQQVYPSEIIISYRRSDNVRDLDNVKLSDLPDGLQKFFHFNATNAAKYDAAEVAKAESLKPSSDIDTEKKWREYYSTLDRRKMDADREYEEAVFQYNQARQNFEDELKIQSVEAQKKAADAAMIQALNPPTTTIINKNETTIY